MLDLKWLDDFKTLDAEGEEDTDVLRVQEPIETTKKVGET